MKEISLALKAGTLVKDVSRPINRPSLFLVPLFPCTTVKTATENFIITNCNPFLRGLIKSNLFEFRHFEDICPGYNPEDFAVLHDRDPAEVAC